MVGIESAFGRDQAVPAPGEVFREYTFRTEREHFGVLDPYAGHLEANNIRQGEPPGTPKMLEIDSLEGATRAEIAVEYWGGHIGTTRQGFHVNGNDWVPLPQPVGTLHQPESYFRTLLGNPPVQIPLEWLQEGANAFQFTAGTQCYNDFKWGFYWIYSFTVRVYYSPERPHVVGRIASPHAQQVVDDYPTIEVVVDGHASSAARVDVIGRYTDFSWSGTGAFSEWHYQLMQGNIKRHIGSSKEVPAQIRWNTEWVPDQDEPVGLIARVTDQAGTVSTTGIVEVNLKRSARSVRMYKSVNLPQGFGVRVGQRMECTIPIDDDLSYVKDARLVLSTWSAAHADELALNGRRLIERVGPVHDVSFDSIPVPVSYLRNGDNVFSIYAQTHHHAAEVNWPGPVLLLEFA